MQRVHKPKIRLAVLMFLLVAVACRSRSPSAQERGAQSPPRQQDTAAPSGPVIPPPPSGSQPDDSDAAFHHELTVSSPVRTVSANTLAAAVRRNNEASFALWKAFAERDNFVVSPFSIRAALGALYLASDGRSRKQLQSQLSYPERTEDLAIGALDAAVRAGSKARLDSASSLWIGDAHRLQQPYLQRIAEFPRAEVHAIDFGTDPERARRFINTWASKHSRGDTLETFPASTITALSQAVLVDTVSFAGSWPARFMLAEGLHAWTDQNGAVGRITMDMAYGGTCKAVFNDPATASLRNCTASTCRDAVDAAIADYQDSSLSLMVVKPESWKQFIWNENSFMRIWSALQKAPQVDFNFPILKLRSTRDLKQPLQRLGLDASDLSLSQGAVERTAPKPTLDRMVHEASFQVDADAPKREPTAQERAPRSEWDDETPEPYFSADYAFYFLVLERETGLILLMGQVVEAPPYRRNQERDKFAPRVPGATLPARNANQ